MAQVDLGRAQHLGNLAQAADHGDLALAGRGEAALDERLDRARDQLDVGVGIGLVGADDLEIEQLAVDARGEHVAVERALEVQIGARHLRSSYHGLTVAPHTGRHDTATFAVRRLYGFCAVTSKRRPPPAA